MSQSAATLPPAVFLMGPTASGKTALAIQLAHRFNAEIISVDSALVYRGMDIGVAKPNLEEREGIVHHLLDILDPSESYSTGQFKQDALRLMADITARGKLPLLVGGTMLYFNALLQGLADLPSADPEIRAQLDDDLKQFGKAVMHQRLTAIDPVSAARIHSNDPQRVQRALEVFAMTGKTLTEYFRDADMQTIPYRVIKLIIAPSDRKILHEIIAQRFKLMLQQGLVDEVQKLYRRGDLHSGLPSMRAVGYRQVWDYLAGHEDYASMTDKAIFATRQLAKRQFTWLRRETEVHHLETGHADLWMNASKIVQQKLI